MSFWTPAQFAAVTGGRWLHPPTDPAAPLAGLSTDTRALQPGQVFAAIQGERFDAHDYLHVAARAGAALLLVSNEAKTRALEASTTPGLPAGAKENHAATPCSTSDRIPAVLWVPDTVPALQQLAAAYRDVLGAHGCRVIAVVGSNGKTTTRHLIHTVLATRFPGSQSPKSFNNHIGVPLTLLAARPAAHGATSFVVVEIGTNHPGEIADLARIVRPDIVVLTSIGEEHLEFFGDLHGVAREEAQIFPHLQPAGSAYLSTQAYPYVAPHLNLPPGTKLTCYGPVETGNLPEGLTVVSGRIEAQPAGSMLEVSGARFTVPLLGRHNALNALAAALVGRQMGLSDAEIAGGLAQAQPVEMRGQVETLSSPAGSLTLINDAYNANPASVRCALATLAGMPKSAATGRRGVILGDMFELGSQAPEMHRAVGRELATYADRIDFAVLIGQLSMFTAEALAKAGWPRERMHSFAAWSDDLSPRLAGLLKPGDLVLLKASRGMGLERLLPGLRQLWMP